MSAEKPDFRNGLNLGEGGEVQRYGPQPGTVDIYLPDYPAFSPFGVYNGYYVRLYMSHYDDGRGYPYSTSDFNLSLQTIQVAIRGKDPPGG